MAIFFYSPPALMFPHHASTSDFCVLVRHTFILHTPFLFILNPFCWILPCGLQESKFIIGAQCNSLQQFLYLYSMSSFISFPFKKINHIFSGVVNWKFPSEVTSISQNYFDFPTFPFKGNDQKWALQCRCRHALVLCSKHSLYPFCPVPFQTAASSACSLGVYTAHLYSLYFCGVWLVLRFLFWFYFGVFF